MLKCCEENYNRIVCKDFPRMGNPFIGKSMYMGIPRYRHGICYICMYIFTFV